MDPVGKAANMLDNLYMKPSDKISTYNVDFMRYAFQLGWENSVLCHRYYQGLPNRIQDPISTQEQDHEHHYARQAEKEALKSHS